MNKDEYKATENALSLICPSLYDYRAGSWSLRALRLESHCGPLVHIFAILSTDLILVLFLLLPSLLRNVIYVTDKVVLFLHNLLQNNTSYTWNVVYCI